MQCPLYAASLLGNDDVIESADVECDKEKCAWWDADNEQCNVRTMTMNVWLLTKVMMEVLDKMPHAGQFLK